MNNKRQRIAKQRTLRQSKVDLATELGLHSQDNLEGVAPIAPQGNITERRQKQLEKIRAMTAELKPERGSGSGGGGGKRKGGGAGKKTVSWSLIFRKLCHSNSM